ncbi:MAG: VCBS repeat-containing protein [Sandaracinaceae bacterium]|nr:VCBS repeat-containing protein [Sandaracinaceae bacterium]
MSTATTTSQRPTFDWELAPNTTGGRLQICAQRSCSNVLVQLDVTGNSARPASNLTAGHYYWRVFGRNGSRVGLTPSVVWQVHVPARSAPAIDSSAGQASDFNGDGYGDVVVGAQSSDSEVGRVHIFGGSSGGLSVSPDRSLVSPGGAGGKFGSLLESAGDVNGDGYVDLVVSAPGASGVGRTYLYLGSSTGLRLAQQHAVPTIRWHKAFQQGLSGGDINGDGYADIVVGGTPTASTLGGSIHVFCGSATGPSDQPDLSVTGANDVRLPTTWMWETSRDGFADVLVSARSLNQAYVYPGSAAGLLTTRTTLTSPEQQVSRSGGLRAVGDLNGDGRGDAAVGDYAGGSGFVHVYYGGGAGLPSAPATSLGSPGGVASARRCAVDET